VEATDTDLHTRRIVVLCLLLMFMTTSFMRAGRSNLASLPSRVVAARYIGWKPRAKKRARFDSIYPIVVEFFCCTGAKQTGTRKTELGPISIRCRISRVKTHFGWLANLGRNVF
jgi:hypothetical protein